MIQDMLESSALEKTVDKLSQKIGKFDKLLNKLSPDESEFLSPLMVILHDALVLTMLGKIDTLNVYAHTMHATTTMFMDAERASISVVDFKSK